MLYFAGGGGLRRPIYSAIGPEYAAFGALTGILTSLIQIFIGIFSLWVRLG